jgi:antitoxin VapB
LAAERVQTTLPAQEVAMLPNPRNGEVDDLTEKLPLSERIPPIQERIAAWPATGLEADKAFYDELSGDC